MPYIARRNQFTFDCECANTMCEGVRFMKSYSKWIGMVEDLEKIPCAPLQRVFIILDIYNQYMHSEAVRDYVSAHSLFVIEDDEENTIYGHQQIHDDVAHFILIHSNLIPSNDVSVDAPPHTPSLWNIQYGDGKTVKQYLFECLQCRDQYRCQEEEECIIYKRHHRDREGMMEQGLYFRDLEKRLSYRSRAETMRDNHDVALKQELDRMHSYLLHEMDGDVLKEIHGRRRSGIYRRSLAKQISIESEVMTPTSNKTAYIGETEDYKWLKKVEPKLKTLDVYGQGVYHEKKMEEEDDIYGALVEKSGVFYWQRPHGFREGESRMIRHLKPRWGNIKDEVLNHPGAPLTTDQWNQTLRKSKVFYNSFTRRQIRTRCNGYVEDQVMGHYAEWNQQEDLRLADVQALKLYTDFDSLQKALKHCLRFNVVLDILESNYSRKRDHIQEEEEEKWRDKKAQLERSLSSFYHWKGHLTIILAKFSRPLDKDKPLYHGVDTKLIIAANRTCSFFGPISTTSSEHIAKTFATAKGMVLQITSQFPRLGHCNAFNATTLSDYPEEQEYLVGHCYVRLLNVYTRPLYVRTDPPRHSSLNLEHSPESMRDLITKVPLASWLREEFLVIHLFREQIFAMHPHLAQILAQYLRVCRRECCHETTTKEYQQRYDHDDDGMVPLTLNWRGKELCAHAIGHRMVIQEEYEFIDDLDPDDQLAVKQWKRLTPLFWNKFEYFRFNLNQRQRLKFDTISPILKRFFMEQSKERNIKTNERKWTISFREITTIFPNVKILHFVNQYKFDDVVLKALIEQIQTVNNKVEKVVFQYFAYNRNVVGMPSETESDICFFDPRNLDANLVRILVKELGWKMKYNETEQGGYKITVCSP